MSERPALRGFLVPALLALAGVPGSAAGFMVQGEITDTGAVLEPLTCFDHLRGEAPKPGPYTLAFLDSAGTVLHSVPFGTDVMVACGAGPCRYIEAKTFLLLMTATEQLTNRMAAVQVLKEGIRLGELRATPGGATAEPFKAAPMLPGLEPRAVALGKDQVRIVWDAATHPALWVFTPEGQNLTQAKGGSVDLTTPSPRLNLKLSDNLRDVTFACEVRKAEEAKGVAEGPEGKEAPKSRNGNAIDILTQASRPLHIHELLEQLEQRGLPATRDSLVSALTKVIAPSGPVVRVAPNTFTVKGR